MVRESGWRSLRKIKVPLISEKGRKSREDRAKGLLNALKSAPPHRITIFSDEKTFVLDPPYNPQNDRWIRFVDEGGKNEGKFMPRSKYPAGAMLLGAVASTGEKSPPIWFPEGFRLNADGYIEALRTTLVPWIRRVAAAHGGSRPAHMVFQQDSAPIHRARKTLAFLREENIPF